MKNILAVVLIYPVAGAFSLAAAQLSVEKCFEADRRNDDFRQDDRCEIKANTRKELEKKINQRAARK